MATGPAIIRQDNFGAGMFMSRTPELIPANGVFDASNCLVDDTGGLYKRGGSTYFTGTGWPGSSQVIWVWDGTLTGGQRTLFATYTSTATTPGRSPISAPMRAWRPERTGRP
jgi:hypothetical protein